MDSKTEKELKALKIVFEMLLDEPLKVEFENESKYIIPKDFKCIVRQLYNNLSNTIKLPISLNPINISTFIEYKNERIVENPIFNGNRLKIIVIKDDFIQWIKSKYKKEITSPEYKAFKKFIEMSYGPYPKSGWSQISLSEEPI